MKKTLFAGLSVLEPGEPLSEENGAFTNRDPVTTDRFLELGAKTHRHDGTNGVANPSAAPVVSVIASGGALPASTSISLGYTLEDASRGETMLSPLAAVSTTGAVEGPPAAPVAKISTLAGELLVNTYYYAVTFTDGIGGETALGPAVSAQRASGPALSEIELSGLTNGLVAAGAKGWRLYRAVGGAAYNLLATGGSGEDAFTDDGTHSLDCSTHPPAGNENTTQGVSQLKVTLPSVADSHVAFVNVYASVTGDFSGGSLLGRFPVASAGKTALFTTLSLENQTPPPVNRSVGGAHQIEPEAELFDFHWKRPVAASGALGSGAAGDVKLVENTGQLFGVLPPRPSAAVPSEWTALASAAAAGGKLSASGGSTKVTGVEEIQFAASGGETVNVSTPGTGKALVTIGHGPPTLAASGGATKVPEVEELRFVGSGVAVAVSSPAGGIAQLLITAGTPRLRVAASGSAIAPNAVAGLENIELIGSGGINLKEEEVSAGKMKLTLEGESAVLKQEGMGVIHHGAEANATRPTAFRQYTWIGTVKPNNMIEFDIWVEA